MPPLRPRPHRGPRVRHIPRRPQVKLGAGAASRCLLRLMGEGLFFGGKNRGFWGFLGVVVVEFGQREGGEGGTARAGSGAAGCHLGAGGGDVGL